MLCCPAPRLAAQQADSSLLTLNRIFDSKDFTPERLGPVRWLKGQAAYVKLEPDSHRTRRSSPGSLRCRRRAARRVGRGEPADPARRLDAARRWRTTASRPTSGGCSSFTNSQKVWRENTRGDFYSLDLSTWKLEKLGGTEAKPSTLMFAKFSPDGGRVAYVRENNLYVENLADGSITQLTRDGSAPSSTAPSTGSTRRS